MCALMVIPHLKELSPHELFKKLVSIESLQQRRDKLMIFRAKDGNSKKPVKAKKGNSKTEKGLCLMSQRDEDKEEEVPIIAVRTRPKKNSWVWVPKQH